MEGCFTFQWGGGGGGGGGVFCFPGGGASFLGAGAPPPPTCPPPNMGNPAPNQASTPISEIYYSLSF